MNLCKVKAAKIVLFFELRKFICINLHFSHPRAVYRRKAPFIASLFVAKWFIAQSAVYMHDGTKIARKKEKLIKESTKEN